MSVASRQFFNFHDPLLGHLAQVLPATGGNGSRTRILVELANVVQRQRARPEPTVVMPNYQDPILAALQGELHENQLKYCWQNAVLIGCSAGGEVALRTLLSQIKYPHLPIIVAMHHSPGFQFNTIFKMANRVFQRFEIPGHGEVIDGSRLYFLPSQFDNGFTAFPAAFLQGPVSERPRFRPDINRIMQNGADTIGKKLIGVILSGMLNDGADGVEHLAQAGCEIWIQDPATALFQEMPRAAARVQTRAKIMDLATMAHKINHLTTTNMELVPEGSN